MDIILKIAEELQVKKYQVEAAVGLIDEGNTIPFISRYRKEATGALNDEQLRLLDERLKYLRNLEEKKEQVLGAIEEQGKLTPELAEQIKAAETLVVVEDLYRPYRPKRRTRATVAKEKGLDGLAELIMEQKTKEPLEKSAEAYLSEEKGVNDVKEAIAGAMDILAEQISDVADYRIRIRDITMKEGMIVSEAKDDETDSVYSLYYHFEQPLAKMAGHRTLAINRGEKEKILSVKIKAPEERIFTYLERRIIKVPKKAPALNLSGLSGMMREQKGKTSQRDFQINVRKDLRKNSEKEEQYDYSAVNPYTTPILKEVIKDSYDRLIAPSIEREIRAMLTETAEEGAIKVFGKNLEQLLMQPPITGHVVLGWDPAFRTGCKLAVVDATGKVLDTAVIYPTAPQNKVEESKVVLKRLIQKYGITLISVGNGTASRESEQIIVDFLKELKAPVQYIIVNEAGASVYSASKLATEEFPNLDVAHRSAASIARRLQDPLAELVKIDPKSIGVGQYQHDMNQKYLSETLTGVVEDCVNKVGVDLNTASPSLLEYVSGVTKTLAKNIVSYREQNGRFTDRSELKKVSKLGPKAFLQCAGFLRIRDGKNPLDSTSVHPESYAAAKGLLKELGYEPSALAKGGVPDIGRKITNMSDMAEKLGVGEMTLADIVKELEKPGRDPRDEMPKPILRTDVMEITDLKPGMVLKGTVRNVIDFGAFVDIGVHQDGLVHISKITDRFIKHPLEAVHVGDVVEVTVLSVDVAKKRIQLSMI